MSQYSAGLDSSGNSVAELISRREPSFLWNGRQIGKFIYYYWETSSSHGGGIKVFNSNGNPECGFATDNPQWTVWNGGDATEIYSGDGYERWVRVEMVFDWTNGDVTFNIEDQASATSRSSTISLINGVDIERIELTNFSGLSWNSTSAFSMWIDAIQALDGNDGYYDDFEDGTLQGWSDPIGNFSVTTSPLGVDVDKSKFPTTVSLSKEIFSLRDTGPSVDSSLEFDLTGGTFSFRPSEGFTVTDDDGPNLTNFSASIVGEKREGEVGVTGVPSSNPSWMTATLSKTANDDGSIDGEVRFQFDRPAIDDDVRILRIYTEVSDGAGNTSSACFDYHVEEDLALYNIMGQEDNKRPEPNYGGGTARAVVNTSAESVVAIHYGLYSEDPETTKDELERRIDFSSLGKIHEIFWSGLFVDALYGFYVEALSYHGQRVESGIYQFTTANEIENLDKSIAITFVEDWEKGVSADLIRALNSKLSESTRNELEDASVDGMQTSIHDSWEKTIQARIEANNFDSNISTSTSYEIN